MSSLAGLGHQLFAALRPLQTALQAQAPKHCAHSLFIPFDRPLGNGQFAYLCNTKK